MQAGYSQGIHRQNRRSCFCPQERAGFGNDSTHYLHSCRRHHNRAVTGLWLTSLHDGKRGTCQVSQGASCLGRHQPLLDIRNGTRAFATLTSCGSARAFATTRKRGSACAFPTTRIAALPSSRPEIDRGVVDVTGAQCQYLPCE
jgi:hypothetical protein